MLYWKSLPVIIIVGLLLMSCGEQESAPTRTPVPTSTPPVVVAEELYAGKCALCHGEKRYGIFSSGGALTLQSLAARSDTVVKETILEGIPYTAMPPFKNTLNPEEIDAIIQFIKYTSP